MIKKSIDKYQYVMIECVCTSLKNIVKTVGQPTFQKIAFHICLAFQFFSPSQKLHTAKPQYLKWS